MASHSPFLSEGGSRNSDPLHINIFLFVVVVVDDDDSPKASSVTEQSVARSKC